MAKNTAHLMLLLLLALVGLVSLLAKVPHIFKRLGILMGRPYYIAIDSDYGVYTIYAYIKLTKGFGRMASILFKL